MNLFGPSGPCSADLLINNKLLPYLPKYETLKTTSSPWKCEAQLSDAEHLQTQPPIRSIFTYGLFFFLDKNLNHWNLAWNFKDLVPMRSYKIRKVESFKSGVLDIWIDIEISPALWVAFAHFEHPGLCYLRFFVSVWGCRNRIPYGSLIFTGYKGLCQSRVSHVLNLFAFFPVGHSHI